MFRSGPSFGATRRRQAWVLPAIAALVGMGVVIAIAMTRPAPVQRTADASTAVTAGVPLKLQQ